MKVNPVRKIFSEVNRAYLAGLLDGDGAIMAIIECHAGKKFGFRVRVLLKISQKDRKILDWCRKVTQLGIVSENRNQYDWRLRDQKEIAKLLEAIYPYLKVKKKQAELARKILHFEIKTFADLQKKAQLADTLALLNVRSKGRRTNFATMIQENISPND